MNLDTFDPERARVRFYAVHQFSGSARQTIVRAARDKVRELVDFATNRESEWYINFLKFHSEHGDLFFVVVLMDDQEGQEIILAQAPDHFTEDQISGNIRRFIESGGADYVSMIDPGAN